MKPLIALFSLLTATATSAEETKPSPSALAISGALSTIEQTPQGYAGPGWEKLLAAGRDAQFFMVGEQHGSASIAAFEVALQSALYREGMDHTAFEIGPRSVREIERRERARRGALADYLKAAGHGFVVPFLFLNEELPLLDQVIAFSPDRERPAWGLDQEFVGAGPLIAEIVGSHARTDAQRDAVARFAKAAAANPFFIGNGPAEEFSALESAFAGNGEVAAIMKEIRASREIYAPFMGNNGPIYPANLARETMLKDNFRAQFDEAEARLGKPPRVFLKFGGYHAMRGFSGTDVPALGNYLAEWGSSRGMRMVNVLVDCQGGESFNPQTSTPEPCESYLDGAETLNAAVKAGPLLQVVDFTALRPQLAKMKDVDPKSRAAILAFDYYVAVRDGKAATPVGTFPKQ